MLQPRREEEVWNCSPAGCERERLWKWASRQHTNRVNRLIAECLQSALADCTRMGQASTRLQRVAACASSRGECLGFRSTGAPTGTGIHCRRIGWKRVFLQSTHARLSEHVARERLAATGQAGSKQRSAKGEHVCVDLRAGCAVALL